MTNVDKSIIARLKKEGQIFEILVDCDKALAYREGKIKDLAEVLATKEIFSDVKKGLRSPAHYVKQIFKTEDPLAVADVIVKKGEIQLTAEHRNKLRENVRRQILAHLQRNAIDAKTGLPHPLQRLESAMEEAKVKIDEFRSADGQLYDVIARLRPIIPIKLEVRELGVRIPAKYAGPSFTSVKRIAKVLREQWENNGDLSLVIEIPAGVQEEVEQELNKLTKGEVDVKILQKR